jgi:hypothetical protein
MPTTGADPLDQLQAVHVGHEEVGEDGVGRLAVDHGEPGGPAGGVDDPQARHAAQQAGDRLMLEFRVVHDEERHRLPRRLRGVEGPSVPSATG